MTSPTSPTSPTTPPPPCDPAPEALDRAIRVPSGRQVILGAGPVGRAIADRLVALGGRPDVVTRHGTELAGCTAIAADLTDRGSAIEVLGGASTIFQCAQPPYHRWPQEFPPLQDTILDAAAAAGALLVAVENVYGYGPVDGVYHEDLPLAATTRKGRTRAAMWRSLEDAHRRGRCRTVAVRASDFYGPGVTGSVLGERFFRPLLRGRRAEVFGDPDRLHTYSYVPDVAATMVRLSTEPTAWGRAWHAPNAPTTTTAEVVRIAARLAGVEARWRVMGPLGLRIGGVFVPEARETVEMLYEFTEDHVVDDRALRTLLGAGPGAVATPLEDGLAATVAWYADRIDGRR